MIYIFEGCDGVGKTTAAKRLQAKAEEMGFTTKMLHRGPPQGDVLTEYTSDLDTGEDIIICDRWHWGEMVYGPIYRGKSELTSGGLMYIDMELARRGAVVILLDGDDDVVERRV